MRKHSPPTAPRKSRKLINGLEDDALEAYSWQDLRGLTYGEAET